MTVCYLPKPSSPPANNIALPTSTTHHALTHFSLYGSLFLLPANLRSFAPTISHTSKTAHLTFLSTDYAAGVLLLFPFTDLPTSP